MPYTCEVEGCGRIYQRKEHLNRHKKDHDEVKSFECTACGAKFSRGDTLRRHMNLHGPRAEGPLPARVAKACVNCHKSKTRCDGREPTCSPCADKGRQCSYPKRDGTGDHQNARKPSPPALSRPFEPPTISDAGLMTMDTMDVDGPERQPQPSTKPAPPLPLPPAQQDPRNQQLVETYFTTFHPHWPLLHRDTFMKKKQPELLMRAVMIVGLFFHNPAEARSLAIKHHKKLLHEAQDKVAILSRKSRQNLLPAPTSALLPHLQAILLGMILTTYRCDMAIDVTMAMSPILTTVLSACGAHDQRRIDAATPLDRDSTAPILLRESYQRLSLLHYKMHLMASAIYVGLFPWTRIDRCLLPEMLHVRVPFSRHWWEKPPVTWDTDAVPGNGSPADDRRDEDDAFILFSAIATRAKAAGTTEGLLPLFAWDTDFALAVGCWCTKPEDERDDHFVARLRPYLVNILKVGSNDHVLLLGESQ